MDATTVFLLLVFSCTLETSTALSKALKGAVPPDANESERNVSRSAITLGSINTTQEDALDGQDDSIDPIFYVHVPESGSGFATTVAHHACRGDIPENTLISEPAEFFSSWGLSCDRSRFWRFQSGHQPLTLTAKEDISHAVVMIREPTQRILSGFYNDFHDCSRLRDVYNCKTSELTGHLRCDGDLELPDGRTVRDAQAISPISYAKCVENCTANMLTGRYCGQKGPANVKAAVDRIHKMGFVGLTDEWALSVCLWHRRFGGKPLPVEMQNPRRGLVTSLAGGFGKYNQRALLGSWHPDVDMMVYRAAEKRFWRDIERYEVDRKLCGSGLLQSAEVEDQRSHPLTAIQYLHIPQSGSGFATTVAHHACGDDIPEGVVVSEPSDFFKWWGESCNRTRFHRFASGHAPVQANSSADLAQTVTMIRDPMQRILSGYHNDLHDCWQLRKQYNCKTSETTGKFICDGDTTAVDGRNLRDPRTISPVVYGKCVENCSVNMLTGRYCGDTGFADTDQAVERIGQLAFVGLVDEWALSICLWHKKFGGRVLPAELQQDRRGETTDVWGGNAKYSSHALLGHWRPKAELAVFEAATSRFWKEIKKFGVTRDTCEREVRESDSSALSLHSDTITPIRYINLPNSGSAFATTIAHHTCATKIPEDVSVSEPSDFFQKWASSCPRSMFGHFQSGHVPLNSNDPEEVSHGVVMIRNPSQRILSGYYNDLRDCWSLRQKYGCKVQSDTGKWRCEGDIITEDGRFLRNIRTIPPFEYGKCVENCSANMLTGRGCSDSGPVDLHRATEVIDQLGFVGLVDEWELSVCLWHKRFGGRALPAEFHYTGTSDVNSVTGSVVKFNRHALLGHWRPSGDMIVFEAATRRFWQDIDRYGVSRSECEETRDQTTSMPLGEINPIYYLHFPESGAGFATAVAHRGCGKSIPDNVNVLEPRSFFEAWEESCDHSRFRRFQSGHNPLLVERPTDVAHVAVMVREPSQRVLAGYYDDLHDCLNLQEKYGCGESNVTGQFTCDGDNVTADGSIRNPHVIPPVEYGQCVENCTANMLTGRSCAESGAVNITLAVARVSEVGFVGLTEEWALSICLWHKRFGGRMLPAELRHIEAGMTMIDSATGSRKYDKASLLGGWLAEADTLVFEAAAKRFWEEIERYQIDREACDREAFDLVLGSPDDEVEDVAAPQPSESIVGIDPIYYLHVPESGSGFATVVAHHACTDEIPENVAVLEPNEFFRKWGGKCNPSRFGRFQSGYAPLELSETDAGHAVTMLRNPSQRVLSGYFNNLHSCVSLQRKYNCHSSNETDSVCDGDLISDGRTIRNARAIPPTEYGRCVENCTANMLTGRDCAAPGDVDVDLALEIVDKLGFVGLADEWTLSVCLWHQKFAGRMLPAELANVRQGDMTSAFLEYDEHSLLGAWRPEVDTRVYQAAASRFWAEVDAFGLTRAACELDARMALQESTQIDIVEKGIVEMTPELMPAITGSQLVDINPIYYLHLPFTGSGLATTVAHHACGVDLPDKVAVLNPDLLHESAAPSCDQSRFMHFQSGHQPLAVNDPADLAHVVVMMRDPTQRALSGYFNDLHDCWEVRQKYNCSDSSGKFKCSGDTEGEDGQFVRNPRSIPPAEYARCVENCTTNILTGHACSRSGDVDMGRAVAAVSQIGFVGLTDEWALSVCLWHKRFGGRMLPAELANVRPGSMTTATDGLAKYNARLLAGRWQPTADTAVYEVATDRFWREIKLYGVAHEDCEREVRELEQSMSQVKILGSSANIANSVTSDINPIYYLHVPESGSGFATTVMRHACGDNMPAEVEVHEPSEFLATRYPTCNASRFFRFTSGHEPLEITKDADLAHAVVMIRDPSQRVLAGYYNDLHDCDSLQRKHHCSTDVGSFQCDGDIMTDDGLFVRNPEAIPPRVYGQCVENCTANMLTGRSCSEPGDVDVNQAIDAINKLGFVGLTDEWTLSICLWHRMFGGGIVPAEFNHAKRGVISSRSHGFGSYDHHALLGHWRPRADMRVFEAATQRFWKDIERLGVDQELCEQEAAELIRKSIGDVRSHHPYR